MTEQKPEGAQGVVMILDDDQFLADMYSVKFIQKGYTVEAYQSARDALTALRGGIKPQGILFDIVMPDQDGFEFMRVLKTEKLGEGAACIALTNQSSDQDRAKMMELGADAYIVKASMIPSEVVTATLAEIGKKKLTK